MRAPCKRKEARIKLNAHLLTFVVVTIFLLGLNHYMFQCRIDRVTPYLGISHARFLPVGGLVFVDECKVICQLPRLHLCHRFPHHRIP